MSLLGELIVIFFLLESKGLGKGLGCSTFLVFLAPIRLVVVSGCDGTSLEGPLFGR